jgi:CTP synthase
VPQRGAVERRPEAQDLACATSTSDAVVNAADARNIYELPLILHDEGLDDVVCDILGCPSDPTSRRGRQLVRRVEAGDRPVRIGLIGKYVELPDAYLSVVEALKHAGFHHGAKVEIDWIQAEDVEGLLAAGRSRDLDGIVIPGGFGERGIEGKIAAAGYAREHLVPCLGLCLGMQAMTIEFARNVLGLTGANSTEFDPSTPHPVIDLMDDQRDVTDKGGTMRLGAYYAVLARPGRGGRRLRRARRQRAPPPPLRVQPLPRRFEAAGFVCSGTSPDGRLVEFIELADHPFWVGHPGPPRVQEPPRPTAPAVPRADRCGRPGCATWPASLPWRRRAASSSRRPAPSR